MVESDPSLSLSHRSEALERRYRKDRRFRWYGRGAIFFALGIFVAILGGLLWKGVAALTVTEISLPMDFSIENQTPESLITQGLQEKLPDRSSEEIKEISQGVSPGALRLFYQTKNALDTPERLELALPLDEEALTQKSFQPWIKILTQKDLIRKRFNHRFFTHTDSRSPEIAGLWGAIVGSFYLMLMTFLFSFPIAICAAIYLEEFSPRKNRFLMFIEVNISNLAAVPSIVFGILGLAIFLNWMHLPRSSSLVGGLTLSLMTLPTMIIAARTALKAVPQTIREAAFGLGASKVQVAYHHVLPLAMPGILTGTIISMARALGETAPLLMIGMMAFVVEVPGSPLDPATALPVQIFNWARNPEPGFMDSAAGGILVLLAFMILMNLGAILLRKRFEHKW